MLAKRLKNEEPHGRQTNKQVIAPASLDLRTIRLASGGSRAAEPGDAYGQSRPHLFRSWHAFLSELRPYCPQQFQRRIDRWGGARRRAQSRGRNDRAAP